MSEYAAAGVEAARKPPDPVAYKGYERREAGQREFGFNTYFPGRVVMGGPKQVIERIHVLRDIGITQIGLLGRFRLAAAGRHHALAAHLRRSHPAARAGYLAHTPAALAATTTNGSRARSSATVLRNMSVKHAGRRLHGSAAPSANDPG